MKHNKFTKATSIVMSAVVAAMAMGHSACAAAASEESNKAEEKFLAKCAMKVTETLKGITKDQLIAAGIGASAVAFLALIIGHCTAPNEWKDVAKNVVTIEKGEGDKKSTVKLIVLKLKDYKFSEEKTAGAVLVLSDNPEFDFAGKKDAKEEDKKKFDFNKVVELTTENSTKLKEWIKWVKAQEGLNIKGKFAAGQMNAQSLFGIARRIEEKDLNLEYAQIVIDQIEKSAKSSKKQAENANTNTTNNNDTANSQKTKKFEVEAVANKEITKDTKAGSEVEVKVAGTGDDAKSVVVKAKLKEDAKEVIAKDAKVVVIAEVDEKVCEAAEEKGTYNVTFKEGNNSVVLKALKEIA